jgi:hypothetical protein
MSGGSTVSNKRNRGELIGEDELGLPPLKPPSPHGGPTNAYPILTEEVGYPPSPLASPGSSQSRGRTGGNGANGAKGSSLGASVNRALQEVLGWKISPGDSAGFTGALNQSFKLTLTEGVVVSTWTPRSYVVQTDLAGGVTGAQASIFTMAKTLSDQILPLLDGLYALDPASITEDVDALKDLVRSQVTNLTAEFGYLGGPRVMRVHQYFQMLLGIRLHIDTGAHPHSLVVHPRRPPKGSPLYDDFSDPSGLPPEGFTGTGKPWPVNSYWTDPDSVLGSLGDLRDLLGVSGLKRSTFINTVADEQDVTNFRIIVDYANSLLNGWTNSFRFFAGRNSPFLGTQLVVISRQLGVISETVDEVRFVLDSVFIGPSQRATFQLDFAHLAHHSIRHLPPIYLEDLLQWMQDFVGGEAQDVIQNGGKLGIGEDFIAMIEQLYHQSYGLYEIAQANATAAIGTARVQQSIHKLAAQLLDLYHMAKSVGDAYVAPRN